MHTKNNKKYFFSLLHVVSLLFIALCIPQFFFTERKTVPNCSESGESFFKLGLENLSLDFLQSLSANGHADYAVGLITNHTGIDQAGKRNIDILLAKGLRIKKIYIPEDDFLEYKKGMDWEMVDTKTNIPICMLPHIDSIKKSKEYAFAESEVLFFDIQDTGISPNSYITTLVKTLQGAAAHNKTIVVLDRPNMLGGSMEGIIADRIKEHEGMGIPMRHGMTFGELARYFNASVLSQAARLFIVPMQQYTRTLFCQATPCANASLLTNIDLYYGSSFLTVLGCVAPFDIGIGTDSAFACLALPESLHFPKKKWFELRTQLKGQGIETSWYQYYNPKKHAYFAGLRLLVRDMEQFSPFVTVVTVIQFFKEAGIRLSFSSEFEQFFGGKKVREFLDGKLSRHDLEYEVNKGLKNFFNKAHGSFIYKPAPKIVLL